MLGLRLPEIADRFDHRYHLTRPQTRGVHIGNGVERDLSLRLVDIVDRRPIGQSRIIALLVDGCGVVDLEKDLQDAAILNPVRVE